jgi:hypothetical protein
VADPLLRVIPIEIKKASESLQILIPPSDVGYGSRGDCLVEGEVRRERSPIGSDRLQNPEGRRYYSLPPLL